MQTSSECICSLRKLWKCVQTRLLVIYTPIIRVFLISVLQSFFMQDNYMSVGAWKFVHRRQRLRHRRERITKIEFSNIPQNTLLIMRNVDCP